MTDPPTFELKRYDIERLMLGTSRLGDARVIRVTAKRQRARGMDQSAELTLRKWARRQMRRLADQWYRVGEPEITYSDTDSELFIRNQGAYRIDQRAIRIDDDWSTTMVGRSLGVSPDVSSIEIAVMRGELPIPEGCDCDCCEH